ncbi:MAG: ATP-binding protein [Flavobacteriales bacterium]|jgi:adenylate kinase|nr:ATP-binding protein [Flavobacteriales bacterium]
MCPDIIFIAGIHGVGKTTLCNEIADITNYKTVSASELLKRLNEVDLKKDKTVVDVEKNQEKLLIAVDRFLNKENLVLLDGHFCLLKDSLHIEKIDVAVFEKLNMRKIFVLKDNPKLIRKRLLSRDENKYSVEFLDDFQKKEIEHAKNIAARLNIPIEIINKSDEHNFIKNFSI